MKLHTEKEYKYEQLQMTFDDFTDKSESFRDEYIQLELGEVMKRGNEWVKPTLKFWITENFAINGSKLLIENVEFHCGIKITKHLREAEQIAIFVATVGNGVTEQYQVYNNEADFLKSYLVDTLGSFSVEKAMDMAHKTFGEEWKKQGKTISDRHSPGLCGWSVNEQHKLFSLLPENPCGITLSDSALMHPLKSVCGIIAIGKNVQYVKYNCSLCDMRKCIYRKERN